MNKNKSHSVTLRVVYSTLTDVENDFGDYITAVLNTHRHTHTRTRTRTRTRTHTHKNRQTDRQTHTHTHL